jgi:hypothetical protein
MMQWFLEFWPWLAIAVIPGCFNLVIAYEKLDRDCRSPFFKPWQLVSFWGWIAIQILLPGLFFWLLNNVSAKPTINPELFGKAVLSGLGFVAFVNANIDLGFQPIPLDKIYSFFTYLVYRRIAAMQTGRMAAFLSELQDALATKNLTQIESGLQYLANYARADFALKDEERQKMLTQIEQIRTQTVLLDQAKAITTLLIQGVRRRDYPEVLKRFGCEDVFLKANSPKQVQSALPPKP